MSNILTVKLFFRSVKSLAILVGILFGLSPVVKTLVASFSSDSIWALTIGAFVIHLFWHDYSYTNGSNKTYAFFIQLYFYLFPSKNQDGCPIIF